MSVPRPASRKPVERVSHLPLGEPELSLAAALSDDALVLLQAAAHRTGRDGQVAVVAIDSVHVSLVLTPRSVRPSRSWGFSLVRRRVDRSIDVRKASGFPRSSHFGSVEVRWLGVMLGRRRPIESFSGLGIQPRKSGLRHQHSPILPKSRATLLTLDMSSFNINPTQLNSIVNYIHQSHFPVEIGDFTHLPGNSANSPTTPTSE